MLERSTFDEGRDESLREELFLRDYDGERAATLFAFFDHRPEARAGWTPAAQAPEAVLRYLDELERRDGRSTE